MPKFNVSCDLLVPVLIEIEADDEEAAENKLFELSKKGLLELANTEEDSLGIVVDSVDVSPGR